MQTKTLLLLLIIITTLSFYQSLSAQSNTFTDPRDGNIYPIIKIGDTKWFQENLRYETTNSHCPNFNRRSRDCKKGNFYHFLEKDTICPKGWMLTSMEDWETYISLMEQEKGADLEIIPMPEDKDTSLWVDDKKGVIKLFDKKNPLHLKGIGWVEGKRRKKMRTTTFWVLHEDKRFHAHIGGNGYVKHAHNHNVIDEPKKNRKFAVRCVCKDSEE